MIYGILVVIWMILIFSFSNHTGTKSQNTSNIFTDRIVKVVMKITPNTDYTKVRKTISFIIRKLAHFSIYFIGGILIFGFINTFPIKKRNVVILTIIFGVLYAISDEIHQYFVEGRSAQVRDVLIDSAGIILATIIRYII